MRIENNTLLDHKIIKSRLKILKEGYASCAIEGLYITEDDKKFMENMISEGLNPDEMIQEIKKRMVFEAL
ncbi:MAG: hypothetical protein PF690_00275 [Deltaproteobacteria bacterium]|jgi:hypothetical protein|nr:hypothetical protein [Deltaproteobacteria bacterium]